MTTDTALATTDTTTDTMTTIDTRPDPITIIADTQNGREKAGFAIVQITPEATNEEKANFWNNGLKQLLKNPEATLFNLRRQRRAISDKSDNRLNDFPTIHACETTCETTFTFIDL